MTSLGDATGRAAAPLQPLPLAAAAATGGVGAGALLAATAAPPAPLLAAWTAVMALAAGVAAGWSP